MRQASSSFPKGPAAPQVAEPSGTQALCPANGKGELVFGQIKQGRGFRQFLLCGLEKVNGEMVAGLHRPQPAEAVPVRVVGG